MIALTACGGAAPTLVGLQREDPLDVSRAMMPQVARDGTTSDFQFVAAPDGLLLVFFGYTYCPDVCPTTLAELRNALRRLGTDADKVRVAFVTVDPERDSAGRLHDFVGTYVTNYHVLRSPDRAVLEQVQGAFLVSSSVSTSESGQVDVTHTGTMFVVDASGTVVDELPFGVGADAMVNDLRILLP